jgi:hypothetical protein
VEDRGPEEHHRSPPQHPLLERSRLQDEQPRPIRACGAQHLPPPLIPKSSRHQLRYQGESPLYTRRIVEGSRPRHSTAASSLVVRAPTSGVSRLSVHSSIWPYVTPISSPTVFRTAAGSGDIVLNPRWPLCLARLGWTHQLRIVSRHCR